MHSLARLIWREMLDTHHILNVVWKVAIRGMNRETKKERHESVHKSIKCRGNQNVTLTTRDEFRLFEFIWPLTILKLGTFSMQNLHASIAPLPLALNTNYFFLILWQHRFNTCIVKEFSRQKPLTWIIEQSVTCWSGKDINIRKQTFSTVQTHEQKLMVAPFFCKCLKGILQMQLNWGLRHLSNNTFKNET